jgi:membrane protease YdiL (CAAX protease family)
VLALYFAGALDLRFDSEALWDMEPTAEQFSRMGMAGSLLAILALLPFAARLRGRAGTGWSTHWSLGKCLGVAAAIAIGLRLPLLIAWVARPDAVQRFVPDDVLWQMLGGVQQQFGIAAAVWIVAVAAPVTEEFLFRGLLYRSFAAHLRPLWANVVQAALFSAMHVANVQGTILLFVLGLTLGTVTRRSGGLLAAIALHAIFNLILALIVLPGRG